MTRTLSRLLIVGAMLSLHVSTLSAAPNYSFIEGGYVDIDVDRIDLGQVVDSGDAWFAAATFGAPSWHIFGEYMSSEFDGNSGGSFDGTTWFAGAGYHGWLGEKADLLVEVGYIDSEVDRVIGTIADNGLRGSVGVRYVPIDLLELNGYYNYADYDVDAEGSFEVNVVFNIWRFGVGAGWEVFDDVQHLRTYVRYQFGVN